jgi:hypothetical protein
MKLAWFAAALLATLGCEKEPSKLDKIAASAEGGGGGAASGDLEARVARLEKKLGKVDQGALDLLADVYKQREQQQAQQREQAESQPQPGQIYAPDIQPNVALGAVEGPADALVTIVEAWDFA